LLAGTRIEFELASTIIRRDSLQVLDAVAACLLRFPQVKLRLLGHTDGVGDRVTNQQLSLARANAVRAYIASRKVAPARLLAEGRGAEVPLAANDTPEGREKNRRIELIVVRETTP
jgi:OmpA-OmpF porin, OOP family